MVSEKTHVERADRLFKMRETLKRMVYEGTPRERAGRLFKLRETLKKRFLMKRLVKVQKACPS